MNKCTRSYMEEIAATMLRSASNHRKNLENMSETTADAHTLNYHTMRAEECEKIYYDLQHILNEDSSDTFRHSPINGLTYNSSRVTTLGNKVDYYFDGNPDRCRYQWDGRGNEGWLQFDTDQDAEYFGVWVNLKLMQTRTYCEGDFSVVTCPDAEHFDAHIASMCRSYGRGCFAKTMDADGAWTKHYQSREGFFIGEVPDEFRDCVDLVDAKQGDKYES